MSNNNVLPFPEPDISIEEVKALLRWVDNLDGKELKKLKELWDAHQQPDPYDQGS
jgi:hypothetical protein